VLQENTDVFVAYDVALDLVSALRPVVAQLSSYSPETAVNATAKAKSAVHGRR
jgi:hypothetical protein